MNIAEISFLDIDEEQEYISIINKVIDMCFKTEDLKNSKLYVNIVLTDPKNIKRINNEYRKINKETDVLSFPMFEKDEIKSLNNVNEDILGDIVISIERVKKQAKDYGHSFERELAYMVVHGFYHLMGYDHMIENEKKVMRDKEENVLNRLKIIK